LGLPLPLLLLIRRLRCLLRLLLTLRLVLPLLHLLQQRWWRDDNRSILQQVVL
jgi:hypothetical protein